MNNTDNTRGNIVWQCPVLKEDSTLRPAGLTPRIGCGHWNRMTTKHRKVPEIFQTSPCVKCFKRTRQTGNMYYFDSLLEAMLFIERKEKEATMPLTEPINDVIRMKLIEEEKEEEEWF